MEADRRSQPAHKPSEIAPSQAPKCFGFFLEQLFLFSMDIALLLFLWWMPLHFLFPTKHAASLPDLSAFIFLGFFCTFFFSCWDVALFLHSAEDASKDVALPMLSARVIAQLLQLGSGLHRSLCLAEDIDQLFSLALDIAPLACFHVPCHAPRSPFRSRCGLCSPFYISVLLAPP